MDGSLPNRRGLASIRFQEAGQRFDVTADTIVDFLCGEGGRVVDTSSSPDETRVMSIIGYVIDPPREARHG